ncbi:MAG TPA: hypothetical protein VMT74_01150 [Gaiellaceae bacterium]|nr:hypothetical protein [Gaiellaceae bacterium]
MKRLAATLASVIVLVAGTAAAANAASSPNHYRSHAQPTRGHHLFAY